MSLRGRSSSQPITAQCSRLLRLSMSRRKCSTATSWAEPELMVEKKTRGRTPQEASSNLPRQGETGAMLSSFYRLKTCLTAFQQTRLTVIALRRGDALCNTNNQAHITGRTLWESLLIMLAVSYWTLLSITSTGSLQSRGTVMHDDGVCSFVYPNP